MTSLPCLYFGVFDWEYNKVPSDKDFNNRYFMCNPSLYLIGLEQRCYNEWLFIKWILYGLGQSFVVYASVMMVMGTLGVEADDGHELGLWLCGHVIYGCCVFVANIVLILKFNIHHAYSMIAFILMIAAYFLFFFLESLFLAFPQIYLLFVQTFS